jgi:hypothetical protein
VGRGQLPSLVELREFASRRLPAYMVPARVISLDALPLTVNGKVDRRALPAPDSSRPVLATTYVEPSTPEEKTLAHIWEKVLGVDKVGVNDNFFELGGDSIRSIQVWRRLSRVGSISRSRSFSKIQPFRRLRRIWIAKATTRSTVIWFGSRSRMKPIERSCPQDAEDAYPVGRLQHGMIFHSDLDKESSIFHDVFSFRFKLPYNRAKLEGGCSAFDAEAYDLPDFIPSRRFFRTDADPASRCDGALHRRRFDRAE